MSKHTPGPWIVRETSLSVSVVGQNGEVLFHESDKRLPGVMDDARLIAAAPELLGALIGLISITNDSAGVAGYHLNGAIAEWDEFEEVAAAIEAITKATGENQC